MWGKPEHRVTQINSKDDGSVSCHPDEGRFQMETKLGSENKDSGMQVDLLYKSFPL